MKINVIQADITKVKVDVIVNAANTSLLGGGGVDGGIHRSGGSEILEECRRIRAAQGKCKIGQAVITTAGNLPAKFVIHTVGPVWNQGGQEKEDLLKSCYINSINLAVAKKLKTIAFPSISTGIYKFPKELATKIALDAVTNHQLVKYIKEVIFVCFDQENLVLYKNSLERLKSSEI